MEIKIPEVGESVREALLAKWFKKSGDTVTRDEPLCEIETDKITLDLNADVTGVLSVMIPEGTTIEVGAVIGMIEETAAEHHTTADVSESAVAEKPSVPATSPTVRREMRAHNITPEEVQGSGRRGRITLDDLFTRIEEKSKLPPASRPAKVVGQPAAIIPGPDSSAPGFSLLNGEAKATQASRSALPQQFSDHPEVPASYPSGRVERRRMSPLRKRIAERLVAVRQQTAMLTTFNEVDMTRIKALRTTYKEHFLQRHGFALGYMPFFVKACVEALKEFPLVNASIDGDDIVLHHFYDIGVAIGSDRGLVVPVLRNADSLKMYEIDQAIITLTEKIKSNHLAITDLEGGTFTISNGGVYGSLLSTPILNPPQSAVLGMHTIQDRPVAREGQIVIRSMMYLALSYDHRIIDGREAVGFLKKVKEYIEEPEELLLEG